MECPGEYLKREREIRRVSIAEIASSIKVQEQLLRLLEADKYDALPHPTFVKGYIKAYCKFLGIDENDAVLRFELYLQEIAGFEGNSSVEDVAAEGGKPSSLRTDRKIIAGALIIAVVVVALFYYFLTREPAEETISARKPPSEAVLKEKAASKVKAELAKTTKVTAKKSPAKVKALPVKKKSQTVEAVKKESASSAPKSEARVKAADEIKKEARQVAAKEKSIAGVEQKATPVSVWLDKVAASLKSGSTGEHSLAVRAISMTWMRVTVDEKTPFEVLLKPGEEVEWKADKGFILFIGNAAGVDVAYDGVSLGPLGEKGKTVKLKLPPS